MKKIQTINPQTVKVLLLIAFILMVNIFPALAQPDDFGDADGNDLPIDGGLSVLIAAGVGYGAKKMKERRNEKVMEIPAEK